MRRREFIAALGGAAALSFAARADNPERVRRVGVLIYGAEDDPVSETRMEGLRQGLHKFDWVEGRNLEIDFRFGAADPHLIRSFAKELVSLAPDVIVTGAAPATHAVLELTQTIPVVFVEVTNEVGYGLSGKLARPDANSTGITNLYLAIGARWLELLKEAAPHLARIVLLFNPEFDSRAYLAAIESAAGAYHVKTTRAPVRDAADIEHAITAAAGEPNVGLLIVPPTPAFSEIRLIFKLADKYRLPAIYPTRGFAAEGGLMAYGAVSAELFQQAATYVDRILHGAKPSELSVGFPTKFDLVVNLKAAKAIGLEFPQKLLARAAEVYE
jgi:putative tryptophan/tyrosine transport system substrate-binding protein